MNVSLTKELEAFVSEKVRTGRYADASDVLRDALRALEERDEWESPALESALLEGVRSPHRPLTDEILDDIRNTARAL